jgi:hypothetical protein
MNLERLVILTWAASVGEVELSRVKSWEGGMVTEGWKRIDGR